MNESLAILCLQVAGKLYFNAQFYCDHDAFKEMKRNNTDLTLRTLFSIALTKEAMDKFSETGSRVQAVKAEALVACTKYEWSSFVHFLGLASVISKPVHSVYLDVNFCYRILIHRSLYPRTSPTSSQPLVDAVPMYIL